MTQYRFFIGSLLFLLLTNLNSPGQTLTTSNLPIVVINTGNKTIPDEPKINATMGIVYNGPGIDNNKNGPFNHYNGKIAIEVRGNTSRKFDKKSYMFETRNGANQDTSVSLLGMGREEDWILHAMYIDKSCLRIPLSFYLAQRSGHYASNWRYVELVVDGNYRGLYILVEKIKRDNDRVAVARLDENDLAGDAVTGGYILRIDWKRDAGFYSKYNSKGGESLFFQWSYPDEDNIKPEQAAYIENFMSDFENAVFSNTFTNSSGKRYTDYINISSFTDFILINELSKNSDGYKLSSYVNKERDSRGGKLAAGPIWDFDQTYGMSMICACWDYEGWTYLQNQIPCFDWATMPMWWEAMMSDEEFTNHLKCRWETLRAGPYHRDSIRNWIDGQANYISKAVERNYKRWPNAIGQSVWFEPEPIPQSYAEEKSNLQYWIRHRLDWMDSQMPGNCENDRFVSVARVKDKSFLMSPNPAVDHVNIESNSGDQVIIHNNCGQIIYQAYLKDRSQQISLADFSPGIYFVSVKGKLLNRAQKLIIAK
jgi:hypothetical protein